MYLSLDLWPKVQEVFFWGFHVKVFMSIEDDDMWSLLVHVVDEEWAHVTLPAKEDLLEFTCLIFIFPFKCPIVG